jgi:hypothetical protein
LRISPTFRYKAICITRCAAASPRVAAVADLRAEHLAVHAVVPTQVVAVVRQVERRLVPMRAVVAVALRAVAKPVAAVVVLRAVAAVVRLRAARIWS